MDDLETINVGRAPNDGTGDSPRTAWSKAARNFAALAAGIAEALAAAERGARAGRNADITELVNFPEILAKARARLPRTEPTTPGTPWLNGGVLMFTPDPADDA